MRYESALAEYIERALLDLQVQVSSEDLASWIEEPKDRSHGDLAFPCFRLARSLRKAPVAIAAELLPLLAAKLEADPVFAEVSQAGPYLNVRVAQSEIASQLIPDILRGGFLASRPQQEHRVMIEYSQPNTHKAFHVGHTRNAAIGDALVHIYRWCGYPVVAANYIGDVGAHIAKCLWYFEHHFKGQVPTSHRGEFLGELYAKAVEMLDFSLLTECPMLDVEVAKVIRRLEHPGDDRWSVVGVQSSQAVVTVVSAAGGFDVGDMVAYARVGARVGNRRIQPVDRKGVLSEGMILSAAELGLGDDRESIYRFPAGTAVGTPVCDFFAKPEAAPAGSSVDTIMRDRLAGVSQSLKKLESGDPDMNRLWRETRQWSMDEFHLIYDWLDCRFDHFFFESDVGDAGKKVVNDYLEKGVLVRSEGAVGANLEPFGLPFLLLLKSDGTGLYATKDLALAQRKFEEFHIDESIYVVDVSQSLHFQQVFKTLELMGFEQATQCFHLAYGLVVLKDGKMSSRAGNVILFSQLRDMLDHRIRSEYLDKFKDEWDPREIEEASHAISLATIKYGMLNQDHGKTIVFDLEEWSAQSGNTGPYMMYAYARTRSILRKLGTLPQIEPDYGLLTDHYETELIHLLGKFHEVVESARSEHRPRELCAYLYDLARAFSRMYDHCPVMQAPSDSLRLCRANLVRATGEVLRTGLGLLGIRTLERM